MSARLEPPKLFYATTNQLKFHDLVDQEIKLIIKLKLTDDIDQAAKYLINVIQLATWLSNSPTPYKPVDHIFLPSRT